MQTLGKQDPYVEFKYNGEKFKTAVHEDGDTAPAWDDEFTFFLEALWHEIKFTVRDEEVFGSRKIGQVVVKASSLCFNNGVREWFTITYKDKYAGKLLIETKFKPVEA